MCVYLGAEDFDNGMGCSPDTLAGAEGWDEDEDGGKEEEEEKEEVVSSATASSCRRVYP